MHTQDSIEQEFTTLIKEHQGILHKICFAYASNEAERRDLYQEMVLQLWKSFGSFQQKSKFSTWMYRVAINTAITQAKKKRHFFSLQEQAEPSFDASQEMDESEELKILYRAIALLTKVEKAIVLMWLDTRPYAEIADILGLSEKNVGVKLVRTKQKLKQTIKSLQ